VQTFHAGDDPADMPRHLNQLRRLNVSYTWDVAAESVMDDNPILCHQPVYVGCAGWNIPKFASRHFDCTGSHLERYAAVFNCCEVNSSFYRLHMRKTWERWAASVPADFRFAVKMSRTISHEVALHCSLEMLSAFFRQIEFLHDKLGPILIQLPPKLSFEPILAKKFLTMLRECYSGEVVWEPRHASWFDLGVDELLKEFGVARVAADPAVVPAAGQPGSLGDLVYFRLHGSPRRYYSAYSDDFIDELSARIANLARNSRAWCVFDNTASGAAIEDALRLIAKISQVQRNPGFKQEGGHSV
jgi:uncharacterized protein YecE (DUF72 family)